MKRMWWILIAILVVLALGVAYLVLGVDRSIKNYYFPQERAYEKSDYSVLSQETVEAQGAPLGKDAVYYTLTGLEMKAAEELLRARIPDLNNYYRQYYGTKSLVDGNRIVYLHFISKDRATDFPDWRTKLIVVMDGGRDFIDGTVNLDTGLVLYRYHGES